jgi:hypothetical protein
MIESYTGPERRHFSIEMVEAAVARALAEHEAREREILAQAFPDGDMLAHRDYHQGLIDSSNEQKRFWEDARRILLSKGIDGMLSVIKIVFLLAMIGVAAKLGLTLPFMNNMGK